MAAKAESIIISGTGNWTFYTDANYGGTAVCAGFDSTDSNANQTMHVAMITTLATTWNRSIKSVQKGCHTTTMLPYQPWLPTPGLPMERPAHSNSTETLSRARKKMSALPA